MKLEKKHIKQDTKSTNSSFFLNEISTNLVYVFRRTLNAVFLFLSVAFFSQEIVLEGDTLLIDDSSQDNINHHSSKANITVYGGAKIVQVKAKCSTVKKKKIKSSFKEEKKTLKKKIHVKIKNRIKKKIYFNSKENKVFSFVKENKLRTVLENTIDNIVKKGVLSRRFLLGTLQLQLPQIEYVFSFIRYQSLKKYSTRPPPYYTV